MLFIMTEIGCTSHEQCPIQQACINSRCENPCEVASPCSNQQECQVKSHQPVCIKGIKIPTHTSALILFKKEKMN